MQIGVVAIRVAPDLSMRIAAPTVRGMRVLAAQEPGKSTKDTNITSIDPSSTRSFEAFAAVVYLNLVPAKAAVSCV